MNWKYNTSILNWSQEIANYDEKLEVAKKIASFVKDGDVIGLGSGSTAFLAVQEIKKVMNNNKMNIVAIPTSNEIKMVCDELQIPTATLNEMKPNWGFDGADEVDANKWLIKGRGGAMFNEKLIMSNSPKTYILVDKSKFVNKLCEKFPVPVECCTASYISVLNNLYELGATSVNLRLAGKSKDGPVITENGNYILDAKFENITNTLEKDIKSIVGVIESGLFIDYNIEIIGA